MSLLFLIVTPVKSHIHPHEGRNKLDNSKNQKASLVYHTRFKNAGNGFSILISDYSQFFIDGIKNI